MELCLGSLELILQVCRIWPNQYVTDAHCGFVHVDFVDVFTE